MPAAAKTSTIRVALVGNPNTGKSTLFTALAGVRQRVGNYPGVTVEKKTGAMRHAGQSFELIDLPGTYSLAPRSPDEMVTVDVLLGRRDNAGPPDVVLSIVDASNLERQSLPCQPGVVARPADGCRAEHDRRWPATGRLRSMSTALAKRLGVPVVAVQANRGVGLEQLQTAIGRSGHERRQPSPRESFSRGVSAADDRSRGAWLNAESPQPLPQFLVERLLLDGDGYLEGELLNGTATEGTQKLHAARESLAAAGMPVPAVEAMARYDWVARMLEGVVRRPSGHRRTAHRPDRRAC